MMRRGFKSQCERQSVEIRRQLGLSPSDPLSGNDLAQKQGVVVWSAKDIEKLPEDQLAQLLGPGRHEWSGFTIRLGERHLIVLNPTQSMRRQNSVITHELAHIMLGHRLADALITAGGHLVPTTYDSEQEEEAAWLGATLLLPRPALLTMRYRRMGDEDAATYFGVSLDLLQWRIRMTGIDYQLGIKSTGTRREFGRRN